MNLKELEAAVEAILFTMGEAVELSKLAIATGHDEETIRKLIHTMMDKYNENNRGITIIEMDSAFQMCTKVSMYEYISKVTHIPKKHVLTDVLLETLSIIAYKQPITKSEIEAIRGVKSDHAVNKLIEYNLICEMGRLDAPGRPLVFGTTKEFLRSFGVQSLLDLPTLSSEIIEDFKKEAIMEADEDNQLKLDI